MPNGPTHMAIGVGTAFVVGRSALARVPSHGQLTAAAGLAAGGLIGGRLPDLLEPADSPNHRDAFHSLAAAGLVCWIATKRTPAAVDALLEMAADLHRRRFSPMVEDRDRGWLSLQEHACYFAIGIIVGLEAGYLSHLTADALTPSSLPLLARGVV